MRMSDSGSPNMNSAIALESRVLPTPEGPTKMKEPIGRRGSLRPERERRTALAMALIASSCDTTVLWSSSSSLSRRSDSAFSRRVSGTPVILETTSAMTSSSTTPSTSLALARQSRWICSFSRRSDSALSRSSAAFS